MSISQAYRLVTLGADGLIMVWTWHKLQQALFRYKMSWQQPGGSGQRVLHGGSCCMALLGGQLQRGLDSGTLTFMVRTEGGKVRVGEGDSARGQHGGGDHGSISEHYLFLVGKAGGEGKIIPLEGWDRQEHSDLGSSYYLLLLQIFKCYMELNDANLKEFAKAAAAGERIELRCPIKEADYKAHAGAVYGLDCSPFQV